MFGFIKRLLCRHRDLAFVRNLYGDQIIQAGYKRSEWRCVKCAAYVFGESLHKAADQAKEGCA